MAVTTRAYKNGEIIYADRLHQWEWSSSYHIEQVVASVVAYGSGGSRGGSGASGAGGRVTITNMTLKIGDKVLLRRESSYWGQSGGTQGVITIVNGSGSSHPYLVKWDGGSTYGYRLEDLELVNKPMNIKDSFTLAFKAEPEKSFRKAGITNGDDFLTTDGQVVFLSWLLKKHGEEFKKDVVDGILADLEKKS